MLYNHICFNVSCFDEYIKRLGTVANANNVNVQGVGDTRMAFVAGMQFVEGTGNVEIEIQF
jgi:hypothetical protein